MKNKLLFLLLFPILSFSQGISDKSINTIYQFNHSDPRDAFIVDLDGDGDIDIVAVDQGSPWDIAYYYRISLGGTSSEVKEGWLYMFN